ARDGAREHVPGYAGFEGLARAAPALRPLAVTERDGLVWVRPRSGGGSAIDLDRYLAGLAPELASYGFERYHHFDSRTLRPRINWKMAVDTFLEAYHLAALHQPSVDRSSCRPSAHRPPPAPPTAGWRYAGRSTS